MRNHEKFDNNETGEFGPWGDGIRLANSFVPNNATRISKTNQKMNKCDINWKGGEVTIWDLGDFDLNDSIDSQIDLLKEDLFQVEYGNAIVLDLGWYPEFNRKGEFVLSIVKSEDWSNPIWQCKFCDTTKFMSNLNQAIEAASLVAGN